MVKSKHKSYKKRQHIQKVKGRRFIDEIRNLDLENTTRRAEFHGLVRGSSEA